MPDAAVQIRGLKEFRAALKAAGAGYPKELRAVHKQVADTTAGRARSIAEGLGGVHARAAKAIKGYATQTEARLGSHPSASVPEANVAVWGAKRRTGWYAARRYAGGRPQHPPWVGNSWTVAERGQGPYALNQAVSEEADHIVELYAEAFDRLTAKAFPD